MYKFEKKQLIIILISLLIYSASDYAQIQIMPLGNSITFGYTGSPTHVGYRETLYNYLISSPHGLSVNFVGFHNYGTSSGYSHFEAYSGWQASQNPLSPSYNKYDMLSHIKNDYTDSANTANGEVNTKLSHYNPDLVLLHVGTNDIESGYSAYTVSTHVDSVLNIIYNNYYNGNSANTVVFLAKIILDENDFMGPNGPRANLTKQYNHDLVSMAVRRIVNSDKVVVVNMQDALIYPDADAVIPASPARVGTTDIYFDGESILHPYQTGYDKMAGVWNTAIKNYYNDIPTLIAPDSAIANLTFPDTLAWGVISNPDITSPYMYQVSIDSLFNTLIYNSTTTNRYFILNDLTKFLSDTKYYWRAKGSSNGSKFSNSNIWKFTTSPIYVDATALLQGPYAGGDTMHTTLQQNGFVPLLQPYNVAPWNYSGGETVSSIPSGVVDWVLVQLRKSTGGPSTATVDSIVSQRAAFLTNSGAIVDTDGISPVNFSGISYGDYYIVIKHRNHLAVISDTLATLTNDTLTWDFTNASNVYGGASTMADLNGDGSKYGMTAGDANADGQITGSDFNIFNPKFVNAATGYESSDWNMDGQVTGTDFNIFNPNFDAAKSTQVP